MSLNITEAIYGSDEAKFIDVTEIIKSSVKDNNLKILLNNALFGDDPCPNVRKELRIKYELDGEEVEKTFGEGVIIEIPEVERVLKKSRLVYNFDEITLAAHCWGNNSYLTSLVWSYLQFNQSTNFGKKIFFIADNIDTSEYDNLFKEESIDVIRISADYNLPKYSRFIVKDLNNYINTDFVLVFQSDGFIINPSGWTEDYLNYDYVGAPWWYGDNNNVGNGGFSLRSKKLLDILSNDDHIKETDPEDHNICRVYGNYLKHTAIKFAHADLASNFSVESGEFNSQFGFHGKWHLQGYINQLLASTVAS